LFLQLSGQLTGFSRVELLGTGLSTTYLDVLDERLSPDLVDELLALASGAESRGQVPTDSTWLPVSRNVILLWYCGTWTALPEDWRLGRGLPAADDSYVVSADAYEASLQWVVAGAHPAGSRQQGFGAWAVAPDVA